AVRTHYRGVEETQELREGVVATVVRGCRGEDEGFGVRSQETCQFVVLHTDVGDVVGLINDNCVPTQFAQVCPVAGALKRVDRDDRTLVIREGVTRSRKLLAHLLDTGR